MLSENFYISPSAISIYCKENFGWNFNHYISFQRIELSKALLTDSALDINTISAQVGYLDVGTFRRVFKKLEGMPPNQYRELHQKQR